MSNLRQAAQQALKAMERGAIRFEAPLFYMQAIYALRAALSAEHGEQPEQGSAEVKRLRYLIADIAQAMRTKAANNPYIKAETLDALADEMVTYAVRLAGQEPEPVALPCCGYADASAVKWNPFNGVVQCHNCGQTYTHPPSQRSENLKSREWRSLSDEEIYPLYSEPSSDAEMVEFARAIEAALKERNA